MIIRSQSTSDPAEIATRVAPRRRLSRSAGLSVAHRLKEASDSKPHARLAALRILADQIGSLTFARDYYRTALQQIINVTSNEEDAGRIARHFINLDDRTSL